MTTKLDLVLQKKEVPYYVYYDIDKNGYRTASGNWKVRY